MEAKLSPGTSVLILLAIATTFGANHVSARIAFDHGASVPAAVAVRSGATAAVLLVLLHLQKVPLAMPGATLARALFSGLLVAVQSFCLYSAVARIPVAITTLFIVLPRLQGAATTVALNFEPIAILLLAWVFLDQTVAPMQILGAFLVVGAIAWLGGAKR